MTMHVINFTAPITSATCGQLIEKSSLAIERGASCLVVNITTMGGECSYGFTMYNFLTSLPVPVYTHNLGTVESMGNIVFLAGERRTACTHSKFLFHPFHWHLNGSVDHARMSEYAMSLDYDLLLYARIVAERTTGAKDVLEIEKYLTAAPRILEPQQALASGMIHAVEQPQINGACVSYCIHS